VKLPAHRRETQALWSCLAHISKKDLPMFRENLRRLGTTMAHLHQRRRDSAVALCLLVNALKCHCGPASPCLPAITVRPY
jgi:hypothetical protein